MALQHLRSSTANKRPTPGSMSDGQLALNTNVASPGAFFKDSTGALVKAGPVHVGTTAPNASPAGSSGNSIGEQWLDTSASPAQLKVWNGSAWVSALPDELPVSKLADGAARQLLQTDAAGTGVEWTSNVDVPGTLDVTGAATFDSTVSIGGSSALVASDIGNTVQAYDADTAKIDTTQTFTAAQTFGDNVTLNAQSDLRFADADSSNWVALQAPATVASNVTWTLPSADGTSGQVLSTNGSGTLSWATAAGGATDKITEGNTSAEVIDTGSDGRFVVTTEGTEALRVTNQGWFKASNTGTYTYAQALHEMRSDNSDFVFTATNSSANPAGIQIYQVTDVNGTSNEFLYCYAGSTLRASIRSNGGLANFSANNANLSDRNVKKDISPAADTWDCVKEWEIVNYRYKDQPDDSDLNLGVIAQQVAESCPEVITVFQEAQDAKPAVLDDDGNEVEAAQEAQPEKLGVKEQQMYWMAIKALQEAQNRIEALEAEVAALKAL